MDTCFWMPLLWVLGASVLAGLLGWYWGKREKANISSSDTSKDLEIQNLRRDLNQVQEKADNALAGLSRETSELQDKANLWREKFNKLQLQTSGLSETSKVDDVKVKALESEMQQLNEENENLKAQLEAKLKAVEIAKDEIGVEENIGGIFDDVKKSYEKEIKNLKRKLKKSKSRLKKAKANKTVTREIEITKSIDIETLKKLLDKVPLKKVSERVIEKK